MERKPTQQEWESNLKENQKLITKEEMLQTLSFVRKVNFYYKWENVKDGWGHPMLTSNIRGKVIDVCVNLLDKEMLIIYIYAKNKPIYFNGDNEGCFDVPIILCKQFLEDFRKGNNLIKYRVIEEKMKEGPVMITANAELVY